jgi:hypothetical protein
MSRNAHRRLFVAALFAALPLPLHLARGMTPGNVHGVIRLTAIETAMTDCPGDADCDGIADAQDVCPLVPDPGQEDADHDNIGDACDLCPTDPLNDDDHDQVCYGDDNCPTTSNPGQEDMDADGEGDACDLNDGSILIWWASQSLLMFQRDVQYDSFHVYRRNVADLLATGVYVLDPNSAPGPLDERTCNAASSIPNDPVPTGWAVAYFVTGGSGGTEGTLGEDSAGAERPNGYPCGCDTPFVRVLPQVAGPSTTQNRMIDNLADWCAFIPAACNSGLIDFDTHVALVSVLAGAMCPGPTSTHITCVQSAPGSTVLVGYQWSQPASPACECMQMISNSYDVVTIPKPVAGATFQGSVALIPCP